MREQITDADEPLDAGAEIEAALEPGEVVRAVVFGDFGDGGHGNFGEAGAYGEPDPPPVPTHRRGIVLDWIEASRYMSGWSFDGGYGAPECYAAYIWTNRRLFWVWKYDGSTSLSSAPLEPTACEPTMSGG